MRLRAAIALSVVSAGFGAGLVACFDLFHSTSGILDACQLDAEACSDAAPPIDFCTWEGGAPQMAAEIACTWMSTCEGTIDQDNDFGECVARALLAYDCQANPNNPVSGKTKQAWLDLLQAQGCADVDRVVFGTSTPPACPDSGAGLGCDGVIRVSCPQPLGRSYGENCALWSQTCNPPPHNLGCTGCLGCFAGADAGACSPGTPATCNGDVATSCPNGWSESIDCSRMLQQPGTCHEGPLDGGDPTSPCYYVEGGTPGCTESCSTTGSSVTACARGAPFTFDCSLIDAGCQETDAGASCVFQQDQ